jgi:hypothetical protein
MMVKEILLEELQPGDLVDLVKPIIEIDTYKAKIDERNIVVAFFVREEDPAYDLSRFIEFSSNDVLDTEVSPAPNRMGYYIVFVEFTPVNIAKKVHTLLLGVHYLTDIKKWIYKAYGKQGKIELE